MKTLEDKLYERLEKFYKCRNFELTLLWQRSVFVGTFLVICFTGEGSLILKAWGEFSRLSFNLLGLLISVIGMALSFIWIDMGKASKAWYEVYETVITQLENSRLLGIPNKFQMGEYSIGSGKIEDTLFSFKAGAFSPSKLNIALGFVALSAWFLMCWGHCCFLMLHNESYENRIFLVTGVLFLLDVILCTRFYMWFNKRCYKELEYCILSQYKIKSAHEQYVTARKDYLRVAKIKLVLENQIFAQSNEAYTHGDFEIRTLVTTENALIDAENKLVEAEEALRKSSGKSSTASTSQRHTWSPMVIYIAIFLVGISGSMIGGSYLSTYWKHSWVAECVHKLDWTGLNLFHIYCFIAFLFVLVMSSCLNLLISHITKSSFLSPKT